MTSKVVPRPLVAFTWAEGIVGACFAEGTSQQGTLPPLLGTRSNPIETCSREHKEEFKRKPNPR